MYYVYLLRSIPFPEQTYIGQTEDLKTRLSTHMPAAALTRQNSSLGRS